jgi:hypothetical protein
MVETIETDPIHNSDSDWNVMMHTGDSAIISKQKENGNYKVMRPYIDYGGSKSYKVAIVEDSEEEVMEYEEIVHENDEELEFNTREELEDKLESIAK